MIFLHVKNITVIKPDGTELLKDISFTAGDGDKIAVIGEEGNGKSTLLKIIYGDESVMKNFNISGTVDLMGRIPQMLPQHLPFEWNGSSVTEFILKDKPIDNIVPDDYNRLSYVYEKAYELGINSALIEKEDNMGVLSGGEKVMLQLLKIAISPYSLLLLDEPTNDLDTKSLEFLGNFISSEINPVIFISHDETLLSETALSVLHLEQVNMKTRRRFTFFEGKYDDYISTRLKGYEKSVVLARKEKAEYLKKKERLNDIMNSVHHAQNSISRKDPAGGRLLKKKMHAIKSMEKRFEKEGYSKVDHPEESIDIFFPPVSISPEKRITDGTPEIKAGEKLLVESSDLIIRGKDKIVITGDNGTGKSLLISELYSLIRDRKDINIGFMPQNYMNVLKSYDSAVDYLITDGTKDDITRSRELLGSMKFTREETENPPGNLSDGQKAKLFILKFIKDSKDVLLLDEPTRNFSPLSAPVIRNILYSFEGTVISVSHDRLFISGISDLPEGRIFKISDNVLREVFIKENEK